MTAAGGMPGDASASAQGSPRQAQVRWALMFGNFVIGCGIMVVPGTLNDLARSLQVSVAVAGQLFADESLVTRQLVDDLLAYKRLDGVDESLHALLGTLLDGDAQRGDSAAALAALGGAIPVTVVWGRADRIIPAAQAESVTGAARHLIDSAGHMPQMERPAEVQAAIEETIARAG